MGSNVSCIMLKMAKHTLKILQGSHRKTFKVCLTIFQHYAWNGLRSVFPLSRSCNLNQSLIDVAFYGTIVLKLKTQIQEVFSEFKNPLELLLLLVYLISQFDYILKILPCTSWYQTKINQGKIGELTPVVLDVLNIAYGTSVIFLNT